MKTILILHALGANSRLTNIDHVLSIPREDSNNIYLLHHIFAPITNELKEIKFDAVILNYCFLSYRVLQNIEDIKKRYSFIKKSGAKIIAIPQDEYTANIILDKWFDEWNVDVVFSSITKDTKYLYPTVFDKMKFEYVLTGYFQTERIGQIASFGKRFHERHWDVGTRVNFIRAYLGKGAQKKGEIALKFRDLVKEDDLKVSISTDPKDVLIGDDWLRFLGDCKYTIGSRGGASLMDKYGDLKRKVDDFYALNPTAVFEEVEKVCFPGEDIYDFSAIGPRTIEAAASRTCQILIEDDYLEGMKPWIHYVPLKENFSNLNEVKEFIKNTEVGSKMSEECYNLLIESGSYFYGAYAKKVLEEIHEIHGNDGKQNLKLIKAHLKKISFFESCRNSMSAPNDFGIRLTLFLNKMGCGLSGIYTAAKFAENLNRKLHVEDMEFVCYPLRPHTKHTQQIFVVYINELKSNGLIIDFIKFIEVAIQDDWLRESFTEWDFCDYCSPI